MKLADTILVALQASMGLALVLPNDDMKKALTQHKHNDAEPDEKKFHGYETITKITSHRYFGVKDHKHHHEEKKHDDDDTDDDDDDDGREEHSNQPQKAKEKHKNDDDGHKEHHSHDFKKKQHDEEDDDKDEDKNKNKKEKPKLIFPTEEFKKAKKKHEEEFPRLKDHARETPKSDDKSKSLEDAVEKIKKETKQKLPFENIVLETPKRYNKHRNEEKQVKEDKKEQTNSRDGKMYNFIHRNGMDVKRDIDINIHAPTYKIYHNSDKKHGHGDAELIKIFHVSSEESIHETKDHKYKHDGEQKHKEPTKEHHSFPKSHHKNVESKNYDGHDKGHFGSEKKYPQSSKGRNQTQGHRHTPVVQVTKKILELIGPLLKKENGSHGSSKKPSHQYKSYPSHVYSDKGRPSPHDNRYPDNQNTHDGDKPKNGHGKSDQAEKEKNDALRRIIESLADLLAKKEAPKHHLKKTHPSEDDHDSHHESEKKHHSHKRPSYPYKEHAEYKHDDNKKHAKLSQDSSSHYEPGYNHEEVDSHHAKKQNAYYHDHEDSKKGQYSHNKPISQYEKKINDKHDDEKNYIKVIKDRVSQHKPTLHNEKPDHHHHHHHHHHHDKDNEHAKRPKPHHNHQEAEHHGDSKKSEDYYPYNKPKHQFEEQSKHNHDDDNERGPFYQRVKMDRKPINYFPKSGHHKDHEDETKAYKDHQSRLETHIKRSSNLVPKLNTTQILNLEALSPQDRKRIAMGLPLDSQTRKEFGEFKDCTPKLITKLNVMYARIVDDPKYAPFIKYLNTERKFHNRKRSASVLTPEMLAKIEAMPPMMRTLAADQLDFGPELKKEFIKEGKLSPGLIRKLEKEYERIAKNPKYKKILEKLKSNGKRAAPNPPPPKIPNEMLKKIEAKDPILRRFLAEKLDLPAKLTDEFVDCGKLDQAMIHKINWEYARIHKDPKYKKILQEFNTKSKRSKGQDENTKDELITLTDDEKEKVAKPKEKVEADEPQRLTEQQLAVLANMPKLHRREVAKKIGMPKDLAKWFVKTKKFTGENLERLNEEWIRVQLDPKYEDVAKSLKHLAVKGNNKARKDKIRKRSVHQLTEKELERVLKLDKYERQALARRLGLDQSLAREFINASKPNTDLLEKLNEAVSKSVGTPQYQELLKLVGKEFPKPKNEELKLESIKKEVRLEIAKSLDFDEFTRDEFLEAKELKGRLLDKVTKYWGVKRMKNAEQGKDDVKHSEVINKLLGSALDKAGQSGDDLRSKGTDGKKLTEAEQKMKDKLEKTKENGWCDEFVSELEDAWGPKKEKEGN
ncbi:uncharacterized protein FPRN_03109 [Fusarium proliferatum]|nr:uncharacterized protein FPRN_03109 [Fusarium proliferatum]